MAMKEKELHSLLSCVPLLTPGSIRQGWKETHTTLAEENTGGIVPWLVTFLFHGPISYLSYFFPARDYQLITEDQKVSPRVCVCVYAYTQTP